MANDPIEEPAATQAPPEAASAPAPDAAAAVAAAPRPEASADTDRLETSLPAERASLLASLNPLRWFRSHTVESYVSQGRDLLDKGSLGQAAVAFQKALEIDPDAAAAHRGIGRLFYKKGGRANYETALKHYQEAIRRNPNDHDLYVITAKIYDHLGKRKEATLERKKFIIVRALEADPHNAVANNNMGIVHLQQGRMPEALDYFNRAVQADKRYDVAYRNLAAAHFQLAKRATEAEQKAQHNSKAREAIEKALEIAPAVPSLMAKARIQMMDGSLEEVLALLARVDEMDPANPEVQRMKKMALEGLGRFEEAKAAQQAYLAFKQRSIAPEEEPAAEDTTAE